MNDLPPGSPPGQPPDPDATPTQAIPAEQSESQATGPATGGAGQTPANQRLRDRLWSFRAVIAVALASVVIGGLGGAALASVSDGDDARFGPGQGRFQRDGPGAPPGMMDGRGQDRMKDWQERRGMGQRQWGQEHPGSPNQTTSPTPSPSR